MRTVLPVTSWHLLAGRYTSGLPNDPASPFPPDFALLQGVNEPIHFLLIDGEFYRHAGHDAPPWTQLQGDHNLVDNAYEKIDPTTPEFVVPYLPVPRWREKVDLNEKTYREGVARSVLLNDFVRDLVEAKGVVPAALSQPFEAIRNNIPMAYARLAVLYAQHDMKSLTVMNITHMQSLFVSRTFLLQAKFLMEEGAFTPEGVRYTQAFLAGMEVSPEGYATRSGRVVPISYRIGGENYMRTDGSFSPSSHRVTAYWSLPVFNAVGKSILHFEIPAYRVVAYAHTKKILSEGVVGITADVFPQNGRMDDPRISNLVILPAKVYDFSKSARLPRFDHAALCPVYSEAYPQEMWGEMITVPACATRMDTELFTAMPTIPHNKPGPKAGAKVRVVRDLVKPLPEEQDKATNHGKSLGIKARPILATPLTADAMLRTEAGMPVPLPSISNATKYGFAKNSVYRCLQKKQKEHKGFAFEYLPQEESV